MSNRDDVLYPVIFEDHDGSWTWSVESGKPYEPGHVIHARGDCCPTRKRAREAAAAALASMAKVPAGSRAAAAATLPATIDGWAVVAGDSVLAVFADKAVASVAAGKNQAELRPVRCRCDWR